MSVLILKNHPAEGPGTIELFLRDNEIPFRIADLASETMPPAEDVEVLVILGGPMSVNEADIYPYIHEEIRLVQEFIGKGRKVLGICLGAQIIAKALGAAVYPGPQKEIGWHDIQLDTNGIRDPLMKILAEHPRTGNCSMEFPVFHLHGETFDIPEGAERLAQSNLYSNQAFRYGTGAYAFQFHVEVTPDIIYDWLFEEPVDRKEIIHNTDAYYWECRRRALNFYRAFFCGLTADKEVRYEKSGSCHKTVQTG